MTWTAQDFAEQISSARREIAGLARRMVVTLSTGGIWQVAGHILFGTQREAPSVENYPGIGFAARPPADGAPEAIVVNVGGPNQPAIVATRDEATRGKVADLAVDEAAAYNSLARVHVKADGTIEARTHTGVALALATKADLDALAAWIHTTMVVHATGATPGTTTAPPAAAGTAKLRGE